MKGEIIVSAKANRLGGRVWFNIILFGLVGQLAWTVEHMFFNTFLSISIYTGDLQAVVAGRVRCMTTVVLLVACDGAT